MIEAPAFELGRLDPVLGPDQLQFIAVALDDLGAGLRADANPVETADRRKRAVRFDSDAKPALMKPIDQRLVELEHGLTPSDHHQAVFAAFAPSFFDMR